MKHTFFLIFVMGMILNCLSVKSQTAPGLPQRDGVVLSPVMNMSFGDFFPTNFSNAFIELSPNNTAYYNGVVRFNSGRSTNPAMFEFKLCPGRSIRVDYSSTIVTYNSTYNMTVELDHSSFMLDGGVITEQGPGYFKFMSNRGCNDIHRIYVGGRLRVNNRNSNPEGFYSGNLTLTIHQQ